MFPLVGCFVFSAFSVYHTLHPNLAPDHIARFSGKGPVIVEGEILSPLDPGLTRTNLTIRAWRVLPHGRPPIPARGKIRLTLYGPPTQTLYVGDRVRFSGRLRGVSPPSNPGSFDYRRFLALRGIYVTCALHRYTDVVAIEDGRPPPLSGRIDRLRQHLNRWIASTTSPPVSAILSALLIGYRGMVPESIRTIFRKTGTSHMLAISGLHLGIVAVFLFVVIKRLAGLFPRVFLYADVYRITAFFTFWLLLFYLLLTGSRLSTLRAFIMAATFLVALFFRRSTRIEDVFILAAFVLLLFQPEAIFDTSFQLTFAAVGGILLGVPERGRTPDSAERRQGVPAVILRWVGLSLWITFLAMAATFPILAAGFHRASPMGLLANLLGIPLLSFLILPIGVTALALHPLIPPVSALLITIDGRLVAALLSVLRYLSQIPHAQITVFPFRWIGVLLYYTAFALLLLSLRSRSARARIWCVASGLTAALVLAGLYVIPPGSPLYAMEIFSVRKGTYCLASDRRGHAVILCNGLGASPYRDDARRILIPYLTRERIRALDLLAVANPEPVNLRAAAALITYHPPARLLGTRATLESLNMVWHPNVPRNRWVTDERWGSTGLLQMRLHLKKIGILIHKDGKTIQRAKIEGVEMQAGSLRALLCPYRCPTRLSPWRGPTFLMAPNPEKSLQGRLSTPGKIFYVTYPGASAWRRAPTLQGPRFHLRSDGAISVALTPRGWRVRTFLTHRVLWVPALADPHSPVKLR